MPSALELAIAAFRNDLTARDAAAQARLIANYQVTRKRLLTNVRALGQISEIRTDPGKLAQHDRAITLLGQVETELRGLGVQTVTEAVHTQRILTRAAGVEAARLAALQSPGIAGAFNALSPRAVESLVGSLSDGSPLAESAGAIFGQMNTQAQSELLSGLALGEGPIALQRRIGAMADKAMATRVMPMVRSAMLGAHRQASLETYRLNDDVVSGYKRVAAKQGNTCLACLALDGDIYPLDRMLPTHVNCRCALIPIVQGHPLPFETGAEWFAAQPERFQRGRLGPEAFQRYQAGTLNLRNFVEEVDDPRWGLTVRERSQRAALGGTKAQVLALAPKYPDQAGMSVARRRLEEATSALWPSVPLASRVALNSYVEGGFRRLNGGLRNRQPLSEQTTEMLAGMDELVSAYGPTPERLVLRRAVDNYSPLSPWQGPEIGTEVTDLGFVSTTADPYATHAVGIPINVEIRVPQGSRGFYVGSKTNYTADEGEFILSRGQTYRLVEASASKTIWEVVL